MVVSEAVERNDVVYEAPWYLLSSMFNALALSSEN